MTRTGEQRCAVRLRGVVALPACFALLLLTGCIAPGEHGSWGARWPGTADLGRAAVSAARDPNTWAPLAGAALLSVGDLDEDLSDWAADEQPLFGADAEQASDDLRSAAKAAWLLTALAAPSRNVADKAGGLAAGAVTLGLEETVTRGIKDLAGRERPDGSDDESFSSGHAGSASSAAALARRNLDYMDLPGWADVSLRLGLYVVPAGTAWARVEARKHYVTDVLAGYAVGNFIARFMEQAFMRPPGAALQVTYRGVPGGGVLTVSVPVGR